MISSEFCTPRFVPSHLIFCCFILLFLSGIGCGEEVQPNNTGDVLVKWTVSPDGCDGGEIEEVKIRLVNGNHSYERYADCRQKEVTFERIALGSYSAKVSARNREGRETFYGERSVELTREGMNTAPPVELTAKPATIKVHWRFENGKLCGPNRVERVAVRLFDDAFREFEADYACNKGVTTLGEFSSGSYTIEGVAEGDEGTTFQDKIDVVLKRGKVHEFDLKLKEFDGER